MTLIRRILDEKRGWVTAVAGILLVDIGLYAFAVYPRTNKVRQAEMRMTTAESRLAQLRNADASANRTISDKSQSDTNLERFYAEVLPTSLAAARYLLNPYLVNLANDTGLVLPERRTVPPEGDSESLLTRLEATMVLAGDYDDIRQYVYALETAPEFVLIEEVKLSRAGDADDDLMLELGVSTYYRDGAVAERQP